MPGGKIQTADKENIMEINKTVEGDTLILAPVDKIDTTTAPELEKTVNSSLDGINTLIFDMKDLNYISSSGLRVLLASHKAMIRKGGMIIKNAGPRIMEVFEITGFDCILNIEN